jgi:hypothetical protein
MWCLWWFVRLFVLANALSHVFQIIHIIVSYITRETSLLTRVVQPITCNLLLVTVEGVGRSKQPEGESQSPELEPLEAKFNPEAADKI